MLPLGVTAWLVGATAGLMAWLMIRRPRGIPPGPRLRLPLLGYIPFLDRNILRSLRDLRKFYGDIFHLYLGPKLVVVLNGYDVNKEALIQNGEVFAHRPRLEGFEELGIGKGVIMNSGAEWKELRKFTLEALREFGFGRNVLQEKISEEVMYFLSAMENEKGQPFDPKLLINTAVSNVTCNITFGRRFQYDDNKFQRYLNDMEELFSRGFKDAAGALMNKLPGDITGYKAAVRNMKNLTEELIDVSIREHMEHFQSDTIKDFIDAYLKEMFEKERRQIPTAVTEYHLDRVIMDLFSAGTETTSTTIRWALLYVLHHPDIQERIHRELREKIGYERLPTLRDRGELPFLQAFVNEVLRHGNIVPLALPHAPSEDIWLRGFRIPKGTMVIPNLDSVLRDPLVWKDPDVFRPDRFLVDGKVVKPEQFIPFSLGRRVCLGESLAKMELFLFLAAMFQRFRFDSEESGTPPLFKGVFGTTHFPKAFRIRAIRCT